MARELILPDLKERVFAAYHSRCHSCGLGLGAVLRVHHRIPVSLGGTDDLSNLVLVCANCHIVVHLLSRQEFARKDALSLLAPWLEQRAIRRIVGLAAEIRKAREATRQAGNTWAAGAATRRPYRIAKAIAAVARRNRYDVTNSRQLEESFLAVVAHIPAHLRERCSYRLLRQGRYISINYGNYLLFRSPAYGDLGGDPTDDCWLIFTLAVRKWFDDFEARTVFGFAHFPAVNLALSFDELLGLSAAQWREFSGACMGAGQARRTREWVSNIEVCE